MSPYLYLPVFLYSVTLFTLLSCANVSNQNFKQICKKNESAIGAFVLTIFFAYWIGMRPVSFVFGDTGLYSHQYDLLKTDPPGAPSDQFEWIWRVLMVYCSKTVDVHIFFTIVAVGYFGSTLWACKRLFPNNVWIALLFNFAAFSFFSYGTNGIRNGLACSLILVSISYALTPRNIDRTIAVVIAFIAFNIHKTVALPFVMLIASIYIVKKFKRAYTFWIMSIFISLVAGNAITGFFIGLGFDDRMAHYGSQFQVDNQTETGFRWDFLLYSAMPIILGYYVIVKKGIKDTAYTILLNTYTLSNAFWVMVIRANYSNRFAYLSWFMYAMVLAYPCLKLNVWGKNQGKITAYIMLAQLAFRWIMNIFYGY